MKTIAPKKSLKIMNRTHIIGLKEFRNNTETYIRRVQKGESFAVVRRSEPVFKLTMLDEDDPSLWDSIDLRGKNGRGVPAEKVLAVLQKMLHAENKKVSQKN